MSETYRKGDQVLVVATLNSDGVDRDGEIDTDVGYVPVEIVVGRVQPRYVLFEDGAAE